MAKSIGISSLVVLLAVVPPRLFGDPPRPIRPSQSPAWTQAPLDELLKRCSGDYKPLDNRNFRIPVKKDRIIQVAYGELAYRISGLEDNARDRAAAGKIRDNLIGKLAARSAARNAIICLEMVAPKTDEAVSDYQIDRLLKGANAGLMLDNEGRPLVQGGGWALAKGARGASREEAMIRADSLAALGILRDRFPGTIKVRDRAGWNVVPVDVEGRLILSLSRDPSEEVRNVAGFRLASFGDDRAKQALIKSARHPTERTRMEALAHLLDSAQQRKAGAPATWNVLDEEIFRVTLEVMLADKSPLLRQYAAYHVGQMPSAAGAGRLAPGVEARILASSERAIREIRSAAADAGEHQRALEALEKYVASKKAGPEPGGAAAH